MSDDLPPPGARLHDLLAANFTIAAREDIAARVAANLADMPAAAKRRRRKPTLARAKAEAEKAGLPVKAATLEPDGGVRLEFGAPDKAPDNVEPLDQWLAKKHAHRP